MSNAKSSSIEELFNDHEDGGADTFVSSRPGRKPGVSIKSPRPQHGSQAWRALEDRLNEKRLRRELREIYDED